MLYLIWTGAIAICIWGDYIHIDSYTVIIQTVNVLELSWFRSFSDHQITRLIYDPYWTHQLVSWYTPARALSITCHGCICHLFIQRVCYSKSQHRDIIYPCFKREINHPRCWSDQSLKFRYVWGIASRGFPVDIITYTGLTLNARLSNLYKRF